MQQPRILNKVRKFKGYVYENVTLPQDGKRLDVHIRPRKGASPTCSGCGRKGPVYDQLPKARRFGFVPLGQTVFRSVRYAVPRGIAHNSWENVTAIGIDEIAWKKGHKYLTLVYQINEGGRRLLFVGNRTAGTYGLRVPGHSRNGCIAAAFGVSLVGVQKFALGGVGAMPGWPKGEYGVTQRGGLRSSRCALTDVVGFRNSTGIASDVRDVRTATEAGVVVSWPGLFAWRGGPCENQSHWSWVGRSAGRSGCPVRPVQTPRPKGSPSIPARHHPSKNTGDFKGHENFVPGLKPRLRLVSSTSFVLGPCSQRLCGTITPPPNPTSRRDAATLRNWNRKKTTQRRCGKITWSNLRY